MAMVVAIEMYRGTDKTLVCTAVAATDITDWTVALTVKRKASDDTASFSVSTFAVTDAANGVFTVPVAAGLTAGLDVGEYVYDISRTDGGSADVLATGPLKLLARPGG